MAKIPLKPEEIFKEITDDYKTIFGTELLSVILYGSGARGDYIPGKSDINFLIILSDKGIEDLAKALETVTHWRKRHVAIPLLMTKDDVCSSLDAYPVEFLNLKRHYTLVFGEDILAPLSFQTHHLRLQIERELKAKILHLRKGYLESEGKERRLRELIKASLMAFISLFNALLTMKHMPVPDKIRDVIQAAAPVFGIDAPVFMKCADVREGRDRLSSAEIQTLIQDYLKEINRLCCFVDRMTTDS
jgi:predicted nucleotidyltransferase